VVASVFLDVLLCVYAYYFVGSMGAAERRDVRAVARMMFCERFNTLEMILAHPIRVLWPKVKLLSAFGDQKTKDRQLGENWGRS
jgi:hypothetical protein